MKKPNRKQERYRNEKHKRNVKVKSESTAEQDAVRHRMKYPINTFHPAIYRDDKHAKACRKHWGI